MTKAKSVKVKVLVLRGGGGHYATYLAIREVLAQVRPSWQVAPIFADSLGAALEAETHSQPASKISQVTSSASDQFYDFILKNGLGWIHLLTVHIHKLITLMKHRLDVSLLSQTWKQDPPDLVISVVPFQNRALAESLELDFPQVPVVTILTDFADSPPAYWMAPTTGNYVLCPSEKAVAQALSAGVKANRVIETSGLVIHPRFYLGASSSEASDGQILSPSLVPDIATRRQMLGLDPERMTGLVMFGANGSKAMLTVAKKLAALGDRIQLIFICGRNYQVAEAIKSCSLSPHALAQKKVVIGFTKDIPSYMQLADFFIGKPGNVSVSEAIAMNLPTIVERNWLTLTQEQYAADWLQENQVGLSVRSFREIAQAVETLIEPQKFARYQENVQRLENRAVFELPEILDQVLAAQATAEKNKEGILLSSVVTGSPHPNPLSQPSAQGACKKGRGAPDAAAN